MDDDGWPLLVELPTTGELLSFTFGGSGPWLQPVDDHASCDQLDIQAPV